MDFEFSISEIYHLSCVSASFLLNVFLIILIFLKSPKKLGNYKYLMVFTSVFEIVYAMLDYFVKPRAGATGYAWYVIRLKSGLPDNFSLFLLLTWCGMFGVSQAIFAVHFFYRFGAINRHIYDTYLKGRRMIFLFIIPIVIGINDSVVTQVCFGASDDRREYLRDFTSRLYNDSIENTSFICAKFYKENRDESLSIDPIVWMGVLNLWCMVLVSMCSVFYFGLKCYAKIRSQLKCVNIESKLTTQLQHQLFFALVAQTFIPLIIMYIPCTILFSAAVFNIDLAEISSLITYTITLYPVVDPLPTIMIIKSYRETVIDILKWLLFCGETSVATPPSNNPEEGSDVKNKKNVSKADTSQIDTVL